MEDSRYLVEDPLAIRILLEDLARRAVVVSLQAADDDLSSPSLLLAVHAGSSLELDGSNIEAVNARMARSKRLYCSAELDKVQVRFVGENASIQRQDGRTTFLVDWPARVFHQQRREVFRLATPLKDPPMLSFRTGRPQQEYSLRIHDISLGGMGLQHDLDPSLLIPGTTLEHCRVVLPDGHVDGISLAVVNERTVTLADARRARRTGLAFVKLSASAQKVISRYIFSIERQRNARRQGNP